MGRLRFLANYIKNPSLVGSITPTSRYVAERVIKMIPKDAKTIVEYGPGDGAVTIPLLNSLKKDCKLIVIEKNKNFAEELRKIKDKRLEVIEGDASDCEKYCKNPDVILSALPFRAFPEQMREKILSSTAKNMKQECKFLIYLQYTNVLSKELPKYFGKIEREHEWRNIPPTNIFICRK